MKLFTDSLNQNWELSLTLEDLYRLCEIDFSPVSEVPLSFTKPDETTLQEIGFNRAVAGTIGWYLARKNLTGKMFEDTVLAKDAKELISSPSITVKAPGNFEGPSDYLASVDPDSIVTITRPVQTDKDFYALLSSEKAEELGYALLEEFASFFPGMKIIIHKLIERFSKIQEIATRQVNESDLMSDQRLEQIVRDGIKEMEKGIGSSGP